MAVAIRSNARTLAAKNRQRAKMLKTELPFVSARHASETVAYAQQLSDGPIKLDVQREIAKLRGFGIYSRANPMGGIDAAILNSQTRVLLNSWKTNTTQSGGSWIVVLFNTAPYAKYMLGTERMIARPIIDRIEQKMHPSFFFRLRKLAQRVLKG